MFRIYLPISLHPQSIFSLWAPPTNTLHFISNKPRNKLLLVKIKNFKQCKVNNKNLNEICIFMVVWSVSQPKISFEKLTLFNRKFSNWNLMQYEESGFFSVLTNCIWFDGLKSWLHDHNKTKLYNHFTSKVFQALQSGNLSLEPGKFSEKSLFPINSDRFVNFCFRA